MSDDENHEAIFRVDTVPPPAGEDDAYNAPTRVGPMAAAVVEEMMVESVRKATELNEKAVSEKAAAEAAAKKDTPAAPAASTPAAAKAPLASVKPADALSGSDVVPDAEPSGRAQAAALGAAGSKPPPVRPKPAAPGPPPPRVYDEDEDNAATLLSGSAKAPIVPPPSAPVFPEIASAPRVSPLGPVVNEPSPLAPTSITPARSSALLPVLLPLLVGLTIFAIGLALYFWAR